MRHVYLFFIVILMFVGKFCIDLVHRGLVFFNLVCTRFNFFNTRECWTCVFIMPHACIECWVNLHSDIAWTFVNEHSTIYSLWPNLTKWLNALLRTMLLSLNPLADTTYSKLICFVFVFLLILLIYYQRCKLNLIYWLLKVIVIG